jgi:hypothetical protein
MMAAGGLQEFKTVLKDFRELGALAVKGAVAIPLLNVWLRFGPPPAAAVAVFTSAVQFLAVMWAYHFWYGLEPKRLNPRMRFCVALFIAGLLAFGILLKQFTIRPTPKGELVVEGYALRSDVRPLIGPNYSSLDALREAQYEPSQVWTTTSITTIHVLLDVCWLASFASVGLFLSAFLLAHRAAREPDSLHSQTVAGS